MKIHSPSLVISVVLLVCAGAPKAAEYLSLEDQVSCTSGISSRNAHKSPVPQRTLVERETTDGTDMRHGDPEIPHDGSEWPWWLRWAALSAVPDMT